MGKKWEEEKTFFCASAKAGWQERETFQTNQNKRRATCIAGKTSRQTFGFYFLRGRVCFYG
jgi:hypothetical protein